MSQIISNEIPSGLINGVNKTFTTTKQIYGIISLNVDGVEYYDFVINSHTIALVDAPTLSIRVDYIAAGYAPASIGNMTTLGDLRTKCYAILRETEEDTTAYPYLFIDDLLNSALLKICSGLIINPLTKEELKKGQLPFLNTEAYYESVAPTSISSDIAIGAITIPADTTNFPASGVLYIDGNIITYTGTTATEFTGCSGVLFGFKAGTRIVLAYTLPTDYMNPVNIIYANKYQIYSVGYDDIFESKNDIKGIKYVEYDENIYYTIKDAKYLIINCVKTSGDHIKMRYEKMPTTMVSAIDKPIIDIDTYSKSTIPYLAIGEMLYNRGEEGRGAELINFAMGQIKEMYSFYNKTGLERVDGKQYKMSKGRFNI